MSISNIASSVSAIVSSVFVSTAHAQTAPAAGPSTLETFLPFVFIFAIFYFLIIRPQTKRQKDHQKFLAEIKRGDDVVTASGILGRVEGITDQFITLEIADGVRVKMLRNQVAASQKQATAEGKA